MTDNFKKSVTNLTTSQVLLCFATLSHSSWSEPYHIVNNTVDISSGITTYKAYGFNFTPPKPTTSGVYEAEIAIDNTDRFFAGLIGGLNTPVSLEVYYALASSPNQIEYGPFFLEMTNIKVSNKITATLQKETVLNNQLTGFAMDTKTFPALKFVQ